MQNTVLSTVHSKAGFTEGKEQDTYQMTHLLDSIITNKYVGFRYSSFCCISCFRLRSVSDNTRWTGLKKRCGSAGQFISNNGGRTVEGHACRRHHRRCWFRLSCSCPRFSSSILHLLYGRLRDIWRAQYFIMDKLMHKMGLHGKSFIPADYGIRL